MPNVVDRTGSTIGAFFRGLLITGGGALALYLLYRLVMFALHSIATH